MFDICEECKNVAGVKCSKGCINVTKEQFDEHGKYAEAMCATFNVGGNNNEEWTKGRDAYSICADGQRFAVVKYQGKWTLFLNQRIISIQKSMEDCMEIARKTLELWSYK